MPPDFTETTFRVRYAETDQMGVIHHAAYVVWLEDGRTNWMRAHGKSYADFEKEGLFLAVSDLQVRYLQAIRYDQQVTVRCRVDKVRSRQMQFSYEVVNPETGAVFATGHTKHTCINRAGQVTKIPEKWQLFLRQDG